MKKSKTKKPPKSAKKVSLKRPISQTKDLPATIGMLQLTEKKILSKMSAEFNKVDAKFSEMDARFSKIDAKFNQMDARFSQMDARFSQMDAKFDLMMAEIHRIGISVDEQNHRNKIVLDGYELLYNKINKFEAETNERFKSLEEVQNKILSQKESSP